MRRSRTRCRRRRARPRLRRGDCRPRWRGAGGSGGDSPLAIAVPGGSPVVDGGTPRGLFQQGSAVTPEPLDRRPINGRAPEGSCAACAACLDRDGWRRSPRRCAVSPACMTRQTSRADATVAYGACPACVQRHGRRRRRRLACLAGSLVGSIREEPATHPVQAPAVKNPPPLPPPPPSPWHPGGAVPARRPRTVYSRLTAPPSPIRLAPQARLRDDGLERRGAPGTCSSLGT